MKTSKSAIAEEMSYGVPLHALFSFFPQQHRHKNLLSLLV